jgi:hypothetical protein
MQRRQFIHNTALAAGALGLAQPLRRAIGANDRLQVGVIGCNGMGWANTNSLLKRPEVDLVAICDVDQSVIERRQGDYARLRKN